MKDKNIITLVSNDEGGREALYLNGKLVIQNNPMPRFEVTNTMHHNQPFVFNEVEVSADWLNNTGTYPDTYTEIPHAVFSE